MKKEGFWQFIKFGLVGVSNTLVSEGVYAILVFLGVHYLPASFIGFSLSVLNAYYWSNKYVFKESESGEKRVWWRVLLKTYIAYFWGYVVHALLLVFWVDIVRISRFMGPLAGFFAGLGLEKMDARMLGELLAAVLNLMITVPMNFVLNKYWAYRQKERGKSEYEE
ncbi:MAG: GtrA family protein [Lachnospiraceae bacterium]